MEYQYKSLEENPEFWGNGIKNCVINGIGSDIAKELRTRLERDGWAVSAAATDRWDLLIMARGTLEPIGRFADCNSTEWDYCVEVNSLQPLREFRSILPLANRNATAVFFGGTNPAKTPQTYSAYAAAKALLREAVKIIAAEEPNIKVVMLDPGVVKTKIHNATLKAGKRAANYDFVHTMMTEDTVTVTHDEVYAKLKALL